VSDPVRIGILGDFNTDFRSHHATTDSLQHAARKLHMTVESEWLPTPSLTADTAEKTLERFDGLWASPGSPYKSFDGMLKGIEFARRRDWPFLGTCGGFQYAFIEFARNVLNISDADSAENNSGSKNIIIYPVACAVPSRKGDAPKLSGAVPEIRLRPGSYLQSFYGKGEETATEEFLCNFEIRAIESPTHRFYLATLFQPQLSSTEKKPHPIVLAFVQAAADWGRKKLDDSVLE
jgi:CTP synthase (UTP-ammonia lyase)